MIMLGDAIQECKRILKASRANKGDSTDPCNRALNALSWGANRSLRQKILHRSNIVLKELGTRLPNLDLVIGEAVRCRNHYVHGSDSRVNFENHPRWWCFLLTH